jgi:hypothetical protein
LQQFNQHWKERPASGVKNGASMAVLSIFKHALIISFFIFVMMLFAQGLVPFSVLFTTSFVQDGHGMLPMLSYSVKDSLLIKGFNLVFGLCIGSLLFALGL